MKKFLQKLLKKPLALVMALLIVLGSVSAAVYAMYDNDSGKADSYITISKLNENGDVVGTVEYEEGTEISKKTGSLEVNPGDKIRVDVSVGTEMIKKSESSTEDGDESKFNVRAYNTIFRFNADILKIDVSNYTYDTGTTFYSDSKQRFRDARDNFAAITAIPFSGTTEQAQAYTEDKNADGFVDLLVKTDESNSTYYSYVWSECYFDVTDENVELNPTTNGKNILTYYFTVRNDVSSETLLNLTDKNFALNEAPFTTLQDAFGRLNEDGTTKDKNNYPAYISSYGTEFEGTTPETSSYRFYLTTEEYAETLSFGGSVTFDTNSTAYGGLAGGKLDTTGCTNVNATEQVDSNNTGTGVYSAVTLAGTALSSTTTPSVTCTDTNIKFLGWSKTQNSTSAANVLTETELAAITYSTNPTTLYAVYSNEDTYTLVIDYDDGVTENATFTGLTYGQAIPAEALAILADTNKPTKTGSSFAAWIPTIGTLKQVDSSFAAMADANKILTITATWNINQHDIKYILNDDTGYTDTTENVNYGTSLDEADQPDADSYKKTGYSNEGEWAYYTDETCKVPYDGDTMPDQNLMQCFSGLKIPINSHLIMTMPMQ